MSNVLGDDKRQQVLALGRLGWSPRRLEESTGLHRETAGAYLRAAGIRVRRRGGRPRAWPPKPATTTGVSTDLGTPRPATKEEASTDPERLRPGTVEEITTRAEALPWPPAPGRAPKRPPPHGFVGHLIGAACPVEEEGVHDDEEGVAGLGGSPEGERRSQRSAAGAGPLLGEAEDGGGAEAAPRGGSGPSLTRAAGHGRNAMAIWQDLVGDHGFHVRAAARWAGTDPRGQAGRAPSYGVSSLVNASTASFRAPPS
jgi:hypothetical protein